MEGNQVTSKHLRSASELILVAPIKQGFVQVSELCSYAARLHTLLEALFDARKLAIERDARMLKGPVERLQTIHRVQWTVLQAEQALLVTAHFDRSWEDYFQLLVDLDGPLLDLVFSHCEGFAGFSCADGFDRFAQWIRKQQRPCDFLYASNPEQTVDDVRYFAKYARLPDAVETPVLEPRIKSPVEEAADAERSFTKEQRDQQTRSMKSTLIALYDLRSRFFSKAQELSAGPLGAPARSGEELFDAAVRSLLGAELVGLVGMQALPPDVAAWLPNIVTPETSSHQLFPPLAVSTADLAQIQGNILQPYHDMVHGCVALVRCDNRVALGTLLGELAARVATQDNPAAHAVRVNVALTYDALERTGLGADVLALFPKELCEGMEERAGLIGDVGAAHPSRWKRPTLTSGEQDSGEEIVLASIDVVVIVQAADDASNGWFPSQILSNELRLDDRTLGRTLLHVQPLQRYVEPGERLREHFGFVEDEQASSQPFPNIVAAGFASVDTIPQGDRVALGELILGYPNGRGVVADCSSAKTNPQSAELFKNGTFLVMRKLQQNVVAFQRFIEDAMKKREHHLEIKTRFMGRTLEGEPQGRRPDRSGDPNATDPSNNDFDFQGDDDGARCPLHAHIRLANPRPISSDRRSMPRIMRRGFSYGARYQSGDEQERERGLLFMAYNASISGQYEVIQRWLNAGNPTGKSSAHNDMFASTLPHTHVERMINVADERVQVPAREQPFVELRWGMYLFVPSKRGLTWLAEQAAIDPRLARYQAAVDRGRDKIQQLDQLAERDPEAAMREWKSTLEERPHFELASDVWHAIHAGGGLKTTPYGTLVASAAGAQAVLADRGQHFSVREYWRRLSSTTGPHYLMMDPEPAELVRPGETAFDAEYEAKYAAPNYTALSAMPNAYLSGIALDRAFTQAYDYARAFLAAPSGFELGELPEERHAVRVQDLARVVVAKIARDWLGMPDDDRSGSDQALLRTLERFVRTSRYAFQPHPETWARSDVESYGDPDSLRELFPDFGGGLGEAMAIEDKSMAATKDAAIGAVVGFAAPAIGCIVSAIDAWIEEEQLGRLSPLAQPLPNADATDAAATELRRQAALRVAGALTPALLSALARRPVPSTLYRVATNDASIDDVAIAAGTTVIVSLSAAMLDTQMRRPREADAWRWLFGGAHSTSPTDGQSPHGCPARQPALGVMLGVVAALLEQRNLRRERRAVLSYDAPKPQPSSADRGSRAS